MRNGAKIQFQRQFADYRARVGSNIFGRLQGEITRTDGTTLQSVFVDLVSSIVRPSLVEGTWLRLEFQKLVALLFRESHGAAERVSEIRFRGKRFP
jgi:hypothetical protein